MFTKKIVSCSQRRMARSLYLADVLLRWSGTWWQGQRVLSMQIFFTSLGKTIASSFDFQRAKPTKRGETGISCGMFMPLRTILPRVQFLPWRRISSPIQAWPSGTSWMILLILRTGRMATIPVDFFQGGTNMVASWIASDGSFWTILKCLLSLASPLAIWVHILREKERTVKILFFLC